MTTERDAGIDYGGPGATCNRDAKTGIRYGIIPAHAILQAWADSSEPDYGEPHCPRCGGDVPACIPDDIDIDDETIERAPHECDDYYCSSCRYVFGSESAYPDEAFGSTYIGDGIEAFEDGDGDVWITKSPYYTLAQFCSPCAPGACYLENPCESGARCYCLPADWFDRDIEPCPYPIYQVSDDKRVYDPADCETSKGE